MLRLPPSAPPIWIAAILTAITLRAQTTDANVPQTVDTTGTSGSPVLYTIGSAQDYVRDFGTGTFTFAGENDNWNQLTIQNGGDLINGLARVGYSAADNNSITVTGSGSTWTSSSILTIGGSGSSNSVTFTGGATGSANFLELGLFGGSDANAFTVTGSGSQFTATTGFRVGVNGGSNTLSVLDGATFSASGEVDLGYHSENTSANSTSNTLTVDGAGSSLTTNGNTLNVGRHGDANSATISNGGSISTGQLFVGGQPDANNNTVMVTGTNSTWANTGALTIGHTSSPNSNNVVTVGSGGTISTGSLVINRSANGNAFNLNSGGTLSVNGAFDATTGGFNFNSGTLNVTGALTNLTVLGAGAGDSPRSLALIGSSASLNGAAGQLSVGHLADHQNLNFSGGADTTGFNDLWVGAHAAGTDHNTATFTGAGTTGDFEWTIGSGVGGSNNTINILDGAVVDVGHAHANSGTAYAGFHDGANHNKIVVSGNGSTLNTTTQVWVGYHGDNNTFTVDDGGTINTVATHVGFHTDSTGNILNINNGGTLSTTSLNLGTGVGNTLNLKTGGVLNISETLNVAPGTFNFTGGTLNLASGATATLGDNQTIGGTLSLSNATLSTGAFNAAQAGFNFNSGKLNVTGALTNLGTIDAGKTVEISTNGSFGTATTLDGGTVIVSAFDFNSGNLTFTSGTLNAKGALTNYTSAANNTLNLESGASLQAGANPTVSGIININSGSTATVTGNAGPSTSGSGALNLSGGTLNVESLNGSNVAFTAGTLNATGPLTNLGSIGGAGATGTQIVNLSGASGTINRSGASFIIGSASDGHQTHLTAGATGTSQNIFIGSGADRSNNILTLAGSGTNWTSTGSVYLGNGHGGDGGGDNTFTISDGATFTQTNAGVVQIGGFRALSNTVNVTGTGSTLSAPGALIEIGQYDGRTNHLNITNGGSVTAGSVVMGGPYRHISNNTGNGFNRITVTGAGSSLSVGTLTLSGSNFGNFTQKGNVVVIDNGGTLTLSSLVVPSPQWNPFYLRAGGTMRVNGSFNAGATGFFFEGGELQMAGAVSNYAPASFRTLHLLPGGSWNASALTSFTGPVTLSGGTLTSAALDATNLTFNSGRINASGALSNLGTTLGTNKTIDLTPGGSFTQAITLAGGTAILPSYDQNNSSLNFTSGILASSGNIANLGTLAAHRTVDLTPGGSFTTPTTLAGGTLIVGAYNHSSSNLTVSSGRINASGALSNLSPITANQLVDLTPGGSFATNTQLNGGIVNVGTADFSTSNLTFTSGTLSVTGALSNLGSITANQQVTLSANASLATATSLAGGTLNTGTFDATNLTLNSGRLNASGAISNLSAINANQTIDLSSGGSFATATTLAGGTLNTAALNATNLTFNSGRINASGTLSNLPTIGSGKIVDLTTGGNFGTATSLTGGELKVGTHDLSANNNITFTTGTITATGTLSNLTTITANQTIKLDGAPATTDLTTALNLTGGTLSIDNGAKATVRTNLTATSTSTLSLGSGGGTIDLDSGLLNIASLSTALTLNANSSITGDGTIFGPVALGTGGTLNGDAANGGLTLFGNVTGTGTVANTSIFGTVTVGNSPGHINYVNTTLNAGTIVNIAIEGAANGEYDTISIDATSNVSAATLNITFENYTPSVGATWALVTNSSGTTFSTINTPSGWSFNGTTLSAVPEPSSFALLFGAIALGFTATRRRPNS